MTRQGAGTAGTTTIRDALLEDGCVFPLPVMSAVAAEVLREEVVGFLDRAARTGRQVAAHMFGPKVHLLSTAVQQLMRTPALVELAGELLASHELAVWQTSVFVRPPGTDTGFGWHQDALDYRISGVTGNAVRLWVGLTDCTEENGTLEFAIGSHRSGLVRHEDRGPERGAEIAVDISGYPTRRVVLRAGEVSGHDVQIAHRSHGNRTAAARVNVAVDFVSSRLEPLVQGDTVTVLRGDPDAFRFAPEPPVTDDLGVVGLRALARAMVHR
jgi:ectoine hydroxylase-related dioxygenase (phytanoyl-CoA dioxygenase family)